LFFIPGLIQFTRFSDWFPLTAIVPSLRWVAYDQHILQLKQLHSQKVCRTKNKAHWVINLITVKGSNSSAFLAALYKQVWSNLFCVWFFFFPLNFLLGFSEPNAHKCVSFHSLKYTQYSLMEPTKKQKHFSYGSSYISLPSLM